MSKANNKEKEKCDECGFCVEMFCILKMKDRKDKKDDANGTKTRCWLYFKKKIYEPTTAEIEKCLGPDKLIQYHTFHKNRFYKSLGALSIIAIIISIVSIFL